MRSGVVRAALRPFCRWVLVAANIGKYIISPNPFINHLGTSSPFTAAPCDGRNPRDTRRCRPDLRYPEHQTWDGRARLEAHDGYVSRLCVGMRGQWHRAQTASRCGSLVPGTRALEIAACTMRKGVRDLRVCGTRYAYPRQTSLKLLLGPVCARAARCFWAWAAACQVADLLLVGSVTLKSHLHEMSLTSASPANGSLCPRRT